MNKSIAYSILALAAFTVARADDLTQPPASTPIYSAAVAAYAALPKTATPQDYAAAQQAVVDASDEPPANRGADLSKLAWCQQGAEYPPETYLATYLAAWQTGGYRQAFQNYLQASQALGAQYMTAANAHVAAYVAEAPGDHFSAAALALQAESAGNWPLAFNQWKACADKFGAYDGWVTWAVRGMIRASAKKGDSPAAVNAYVMDYLTKYTVPVVGADYIACYDAINRAPAHLSVADFKQFLVALLTVVDVTDGNADFLGRVQSQFNVLNLNPLP